MPTVRNASLNSPSQLLDRRLTLDNIYGEPQGVVCSINLGQHIGLVSVLLSTAASLRRKCSSWYLLPSKLLNCVLIFNILYFLIPVITMQVFLVATTCISRNNTCPCSCIMHNNFWLSAAGCLSEWHNKSLAINHKTIQTCVQSFTISWVVCSTNRVRKLSIQKKVESQCFELHLIKQINSVSVSICAWTAAALDDTSQFCSYTWSHDSRSSYQLMSSCSFIIL